MKRQGFTLVELMIAMTIGAILTGMVVFMFIACFRSWNAGEARAKLRMEMSQAMELMVKDLGHASALIGLEPHKISFVVFQDGEEKAYWFHAEPAGETTFQLYQGLDQEEGPVIVSGLTSKEVFATSDGRMVTVNLSAAREGATLHMRTNVTMRNL